MLMYHSTNCSRKCHFYNANAESSIERPSTKNAPIVGPPSGASSQANLEATCDMDLSLFKHLSVTLQPKPRRNKNAKRPKDVTLLGTRKLKVAPRAQRKTYVAQPCVKHHKKQRKPLTERMFCMAASGGGYG